MIIGLTGSKTFENKSKINEIIFKLKEYKETENTIIRMGDLIGDDKYVKKYALEMGFIYKEMNAPHTVKNLYSLMSDAYYDKPYTNKNLLLRNQIYCKYIDNCVIFDDTNLTDKKIINVVNQLTKLRKKAIIITS